VIIYRRSSNQSFITDAWRSGEIKEKPGGSFWAQIAKTGVNAATAGD
jgi:hypothetical protein